jgi:pilus assembly protein Flp/PilA
MQSSRRSLERGQGLVEYALALVLVAVVVIVVLALTGVSVRKVFCGIVYQVRGTSSAGVSACPEPNIIFTGMGGGTISGSIVAEAVVQDDEGRSNIQHVRFYLDGSATQFRSEGTYRYCLGGGDGECLAFNTTAWSNGSHTLRVVATDSDGNIGEVNLVFVVSN